jgi:hypothetical protein
MLCKISFAGSSLHIVDGGIFKSILNGGRLLSFHGRIVGTSVASRGLQLVCRWCRIVFAHV